MRHPPSLYAALLLTSGLSLTTAWPLLAQDDTAEPSYLENFLEETLSGDNQFITVTGLTGAFSAQASIDEITVADENGVWLRLKGAELDWNRLALLSGDLSVNHLKATEIIVLRAPTPLPQDTNLPSPEATPFQMPELPVSIELGQINIARISLDEALFGFAASLRLQGGMKLAAGSLDASLKVERLDKLGDRLHLEAGYANDTHQITLDLELDEAAGGLISTALALPGAPSLQLNATGNGPLEAFNAKVSLASNGSERLAGNVTLAALSAPAAVAGSLSPDDTAETTAPGGLGFSADLGGDIDVLLLPAYRPFFGPDLTMTLRGNTTAEAGLVLDSFALRSRALHLAGALALTPAGQLDTANIKAAITAPKGQAAVILPLAGADTTLARAEVLAHKTSDGPWSLAADLRQLSHPQALIKSGQFSAQGMLAQKPGSPAALDGEITAALQGVQLRDPAVATAIGSDISLASALTTQTNGAVTLQGFLLQGEDYQASGDLSLSGLDTGLKIDADLRLGAASLARFSELAGQPLNGALQAQLDGSITPLSGAFDADLALQGQALTTGITELDRLTKGNLSLTFSGGRSATGLQIKAFRLNSGHLSAQASGALDSQVGTLSLKARLDDLNLLLPGSSESRGALDLEGDLARQGDSLKGSLRLNGPNHSFANLAGALHLDGNADLTFEATLAELQRFLPELPGEVVAKGQVLRRSARWQINAEAQAPAGAEANVVGSFDEASGMADMSAKGQLRLEGANPFIKPNLIRGAAAFDLTLKGAPSLAALQGSITTEETSLALPAAAQRLDNIAAKITLKDAGAHIQLSAQPRDGGSLAVTGPLALTPPFDGALKIAMTDVIVSDHLSYETILNGDLSFAGQLASNSRLSGQINIGETNLNLNTAGGAISAAPIPPIRHIGETRAARQTRSRAGLTQSTASSGTDTRIALDLLIDAPNRIFARGRGLNAELGGQIHLRGTTAALAPSGQISLLRGRFDILGRRLELDEGRITLLGDLKPHLEFSSSASTSSGTATLKIEGSVDAPVINVTSDPPRPSEEALALLLFGDNLGDLSPLALARLAKSALDLSGRELGGQSGLRDKTGADNVEVGLDNIGSGLLGLGGYIGDKAYTDFNVNTKGDSELSINVDLSNSVTVTGTVDSEGESGFGLFFKRDY